MKASFTNVICSTIFILSELCFIDGWFFGGSQPSPLTCPQVTEYDYIIVGGGSSGAVVANRLSENSSMKVLLLEAGGVPTHESEIPINTLEVLTTNMNWGYYTVPQKHCCQFYANNKVPVYAGKALGGGSAVNGMTYSRGAQKDYDLWANLTGSSQWSYKSVLPYFLKLEDYRIPYRVYDAKYHNQGGPITVSLPTFQTPLARSFIEAGLELGYPETDSNAEFKYGFEITPANTKRGLRWGTYRGYILPAMNRSNLLVLTESFVTKVKVDPATKTATGVEFERGNSKCNATARKEVILSAGAIQSPKILMLSGIGPKETLQKFKIPVVMDLPGVGQNLKDHPQFRKISASVEVPVGFRDTRYNTPYYRAQWEKTGTGPFDTPAKFEAVSYLNSSFETQYSPDLEFFMLSDIWGPVGLISDANFGAVATLENILVFANYLLFKDTFAIVPVLLTPKSVGNLTLRSSDPHDHPLIDLNMLAEIEDVKRLIDGIKIAERLIRTYPFQRFGAKQAAFGPAPSCQNFLKGDDAYYECFVRVYCGSTAHPVSTCKMTADTDPMGVVDTELKVRGVKRLRVIDGSIMPEIPRAHTNIPCIMIGEKGADLIKQTW